ncbi:MAG: alpha/beta hydrolase [Deltaproteobacteria bacterium]|nr:alpha/beta hydrolase [Deltaproteobacteria bacterium]
MEPGKTNEPIEGDVTMQPEEFYIQTPFLRFAAKRWGNSSGLPVLALHGWLDNAASFDGLAPCLPDLHLVALDMAGHGHSGHRPPGMKYHYMDYIDDVMAVADVLGWDRFALLGHSLGAGISSVVAGSFPERVTHLVLLEGIGPMSREADNVGQSLSRSVQQMKRFLNKRTLAYPDFETAVEARVKVGDMDTDSVQILVRRNLVETEEGLAWRSDPRLKAGSPLYMTEEQVLGFLKGITAPTLLVTGDKGLNQRMLRLQARAACVENIQQHMLPGGHHLHLDDPEPVAKIISDHLSSGN